MSSPQLTKSILKAKSPSSLGELEVRIGQATAELTARLAALDSEGGAVREKVQLLEDAQTLQVVCHLSSQRQPSIQGLVAVFIELTFRFPG